MQLAQNQCKTSSFLNQKLSNKQLNLIDTQLYATGSKPMQNFSFLNQKLSNTQLN